MGLRSKLMMVRSVLRGLKESDLDPDPIAQFRRWFAEARRAGLYLPEAMAVATATPDGKPSVRMMLLKTVDRRGFVFFTNYGSRKAGEMEENPQAAVVVHWSELQRQVRIEGRLRRISQEESEAYFRTRPRGSQLGAWASAQSEVIPGREFLEKRMAEHEKSFAGREVPLPPFWGGYLLTPERLEFWQGRVNRLHDRLRYVRTGDAWKVERLSP